MELLRPRPGNGVVSRGILLVPLRSMHRRKSKPDLLCRVGKLCLKLLNAGRTSYTFLCESHCTEESVRGWYHRKCYSTYTNKTLLGRLPLGRGHDFSSHSELEEIHVCDDGTPCTSKA